MCVYVVCVYVVCVRVCVCGGGGGLCGLVAQQGHTRRGNVSMENGGVMREVADPLACRAVSCLHPLLASVTTSHLSSPAGFGWAAPHPVPWRWLAPTCPAAPPARLLLPVASCPPPLFGTVGSAGTGRWYNLVNPTKSPCLNKHHPRTLGRGGTAGETSTSTHDRAGRGGVR